MQKISYARYRFPPAIIQHAVWPYFRFPLSFRDVENLLAKRGIDVSNETVRRWVLKFGRRCHIFEVTATIYFTTRRFAGKFL